PRRLRLRLSAGGHDGRAPGPGGVRTARPPTEAGAGLTGTSRVRGGVTARGGGGQRVRAADADEHEREHAGGADAGVAPVHSLVDLHTDDLDAVRLRDR